MRHRDRSVAQVELALGERGIEPDTREAALEVLRRTGLLDDGRFAERRAAVLADRGASDAFIRHDLDVAGIGHDVVEHALGTLEGEHERASRVVERRGASPKTARYLASKGFSNDVVHAVIARAAGESLG